MRDKLDSPLLPPDLPKFLTTAETAAITRFSEKTIGRRIKDGSILAIRSSPRGRIRIPIAALIQFLEEAHA